MPLYLSPPINIFTDDQWAPFRAAVNEGLGSAVSRRVDSECRQNVSRALLRYFAQGAVVEGIKDALDEGFASILPKESDE